MFKGMPKFDAVVLSWHNYINAKGTGVSKKAEDMYLVAYIRPLKIQGLLLPEPCSTKDPYTQRCIISLHPVAFTSVAIKGGKSVNLKVGDVVSCYFVEKGPEHEGKLIGLRFDFSSKKRVPGNFDTTCLKDGEFKSAIPTDTDESDSPKKLGDGSTLGGKLSDIKGPNCSKRKENFGVKIPKGVHGDARMLPATEALIKANPNNYWVFDKSDELPADWDIKDWDIEHLMDKGTNKIVQNKKALRLLQFCNRRHKQWKHPPIKITSEVISSRNGSYRAPITNLRQCGARMSRHQYGDAYDIYWKEHTKQQKINLLANLYNAGFRGFGFGITNTHADTRSGYKSWLYPGGKMIKESEFNKGMSQVK